MTEPQKQHLWSTSEMAQDQGLEVEQIMKEVDNVKVSGQIKLA